MATNVTDAAADCLRAARRARRVLEREYPAGRQVRFREFGKRVVAGQVFRVGYNDRTGEPGLMVGVGDGVTLRRVCFVPLRDLREQQ